MFFMNKKSRMCDNCKHIRIVKQIKSEEEYLTLGTLEEVLALLVAHNAELSRTGCILNVAVATRLVQFVSRKSCTCSRRVWLNGISLVEQTFGIYL